MADKVLYGLDNVHVAFVSSTSPYTWEDPIPIPGAVNFTCDPEQAEQSFYADNVRYFYSNKNNGYTGELEMALVPEAILAEMLGWEIDSNGMLVEIADGKPKEFALLCECEGDEQGRRWVYYRCVASRPSEAHATSEESESISTTTLNLRVLPVKVGTKNIVKAIAPPDCTAFDNWFNSVVLPGSDGIETDTSILESCLAFIETLDPTAYTTETWTALQNKVSAANTLLTGSPTQSQVDAMVDQLIAAILALEEAGE